MTEGGVIRVDDIAHNDRMLEEKATIDPLPQEAHLSLSYATQAC